MRRHASALAFALAGVLALAVGVPPPPPHVLLLVDASASMASQNRIYKVNVAVKGFIDNFLPQEVKLSIWKFSSDAVNLNFSIKNDSNNIWEEIVNSLTILETGSANIAFAIEDVMKQVNKPFNMLLITDGNDKYLASHLQTLKQTLSLSQCTVFVALMGDTLQNIELLKELSDGHVSHIADSNAVLALLHKMQTLLPNLKNRTETTIIHEKEFTIDERLHSTFAIDSAVIPNTCIYLYYWPFPIQLVTHLISPQNKTQEMSATEKSGYMKLCHLEEMVGVWEINLYFSQFNKFLALQVTAHTHNEPAIIFDCWVNQVENSTTIFGTLHSVNYITNETKISVDLIGQDGEVKKQELIEVFSGDSDKHLQGSLYTRKHFNILSNGYYNIRCWASGKLWQGAGSDIAVQPFSRVLWANKTYQIMATDGLSIPSKINDLLASVESVLGVCSIIMQFTVPENSIKYKVKYSFSLHELLSVKGIILSTVPGKSGTQEKVTFKIPLHSLRSPELYIAVSAVGKQEVESESSNIVTVECQKNHTEVTTFSPEIAEKNLNLSTSFTDQENYQIYSNSTTEFPTKNMSEINTSSSTNEYPTSITEGNKWSENYDDRNSSASNITDLINLNSLDVAHEGNSSSWSVTGVVGILIGVILAAVIGMFIYHKIYSRQRCGSYQIAFRRRNSVQRFDDQDDL